MITMLVLGNMVLQNLVIRVDVVLHSADCCGPSTLIRYWRGVITLSKKSYHGQTSSVVNLPISLHLAYYRTSQKLGWAAAYQVPIFAIMQMR